MAGLLAHHWLAADDEDKAVAYLTRAGDRARQEYALDEAIAHYRELLPILGAARRARTRSRWCCSSSRSRCTCRCGSRRRTRRTSARSTSGRRRAAGRAPDRDRSASRRASCRTTPTRGRRSRGRTSSSACSCSTGWSRRGPSARSCPRSPSGGRSPTTGSGTCSTCARACAGRDGEPLTAHDVEFGIKRVLNPDAPGLVGGDLLRARERAGLLPATQRGRRRDRRPGARRPDGRVPAGRAGAVLHERDEPSRRRAAAAARDRARRRRVDRRSGRRW